MKRATIIIITIIVALLIVSFAYAVEIPPGMYTVGKDIPAGRYKIHGGSSNFFVYSSSGSLEVNIILGGRYGVEEYLYTFKSGDEVEARSSFKLTPIE